MVFARNKALCGSSPRVRGKPIELAGTVYPARLIPACAGKTRQQMLPYMWIRAHPRVCGENSSWEAESVCAAGSSPRVRGKLYDRWRASHDRRLIPACAGKTSWMQAATKSGKAHPRVCGENARAKPGKPSTAGSSPRVRGKQWFDGTGSPTGRLIPACAGKTRGWRAKTRSGRAHPRVCGENARPGTQERFRQGSSPRVRGKLTDAGQEAGDCGLIPACAGKTVVARSKSSGRGAHPRVCGENSATTFEGAWGNGSSPRVRGKPLCFESEGVETRLIPACAGKTRSALAALVGSWAHPRVCGENQTTSVKVSARIGSSPRVRGKHRAPRGGARLFGLIPACAGKTDP